MGSPVPSAEWNRLQCLTCYSFQVLLASWLLFPALWVCSQWCSSRMMLALPPMALQGPVSPLLNAQKGLELPMEIVLQALELGQTASTGACTDSIQATLSAQSSVTTSYPAVCGTSSGHHMYLDMGSTASNTATITISLAASSASAKWNVLASQLECNTNYLAPGGCTMYLTGVTGSWSMYGYLDGTTTTEHLWNQDFKVCIRRESGYCSIRHTAQSSTSFDLSSAANADTAISVSGATCYADFINIPGGSLDGNPATVDRYCGGALGYTSPGVPVSQAVISKVTPFEVTVHTDGTETGSATPYGVALNYQQLAC